MKKYVPHLIIFLVLGSISFLGVGLFSMHSAHEKDKARKRQIFEQEGILHSGDRLVEQGLYEEALKKYETAGLPDFIEQEMDKSGPINRKLRLFRILGKYQEASDELKWYEKINPNGDSVREQRLELEALIAGKSGQSDEAVLKHVQFLKEKYKACLPPQGYCAAYSEIPISIIIRLYDTIGDYNAGIAYIDMILNWTFETDKEFLQLKGRINNVQQSEHCMEQPPDKNPDWHACKWLREFLLIREAFEKDKAEGAKGCVDAKSGEVCMGRATKALIESDYFLW